MLMEVRTLLHPQLRDALWMLSDTNAAEFAALSDLAFTATDPEVREHAAEALKVLRRKIHSAGTPSAR
jgi:hypothetical protein